MDPLSISASTLTIVDTCLKSGKVLIQLYKDHQSADIQVPEILLKLKTIWHKTETQMTFLKKIWDSLEPDFQNNQILLLGVLESKLQQAINLLNSVIGAKSESGVLEDLIKKKGSLKKSRYVLSVKGSLDKTVSDIQEWHSQFDPSWYLLSRVGNRDVDQNLAPHSKDEPLVLLAALRKSVRSLNTVADGAPPRPISSRDFLGPRRLIAMSPIATAQIEGRTHYGIVDTMPVNQSMSATSTTRNVMALSKSLACMDPSVFGLLRCCGVINKTDRYEFVFEVPHGLRAPRSLRDLLHGAEPSLNMKIALAKQLAKSVFYVHAAGFVHKNIRPEAILVFEGSDNDRSLFLCGFGNFRATTEDSLKVGDSIPAHELYRHPLRQGDNPEQRYVMQHDIYSLGVCLLEIGLWKPFVRSEGGRKVVEFEQHRAGNDALTRAFAVKTQMLVAADEQLAQRMGERWKGIVNNCLTCLDDDSTWQQVDGASAPEIEVGFGFIENVIVQLHEIVI